MFHAVLICLCPMLRLRRCYVLCFVRYGVAIGSTLAPLVRVLMVLCAPITWPLGKLLDWTLGHESVTMKRQQLKAMVQLHGEGAGKGAAPHGSNDRGVCRGCMQGQCGMYARPKSTGAAMWMFCHDVPGKTSNIFRLVICSGR